jgi:response regulator RpfG family c-di-GMP phosphodiesterase
VLLTDVVMLRMNGRELAERLAPLRPEMSVLYVSGCTDDRSLHSGVLESDLAFLSKPITPNALTRKLREVIDSSNQAKILRASGAGSESAPPKTGPCSRDTGDSCDPPP